MYYRWLWFIALFVSAFVLAFIFFNLYKDQIRALPSYRKSGYIGKQNKISISIDVILLLFSLFEIVDGLVSGKVYSVTHVFIGGPSVVQNTDFYLYLFNILLWCALFIYCGPYYFAKLKIR